MISIVLVSHSETLGKGVHELMQQMAKDVSIAIAAGTDNPDEPIGTDPMKVMAAIESVYSDDGVLILMDLGSALMSAEAAIEFLEPEQQEKIYLCEVPLVEGGLAAAVAAAGGGSMEFIIQEAREALADKTAQLEPVLRIPPTPLSASSLADTDSSDLQQAAESEISVTLPNKLGLHARPAAKLISALADFDADVRITYGERRVNARSLNKIVTLGSRQGDILLFQASGPDANAALLTIQELAADNFGDKDESPPNIPQESEEEPPTSRPQRFAERPDAPHGIPTSEGVAIGPVVIVGTQRPVFTEQPAKDIDAERSRLQSSIAMVQKELTLLQGQTERTVGPDEAAIFEAQRLMLSDPDLQEQAETLLTELRLNAEGVWQRAIDATVKTYQALDDDYLRGRAADLEDVGWRVLRHLCGEESSELSFDQPSIVVASDLHPSDTAQLPTDMVLGLLLERGGATSHSAILARALGIPAVVGFGPILQSLSNGQVIGLDGSSGQVWLSPSEEQAANLAQQRQAWLDEKQQLLALSSEPTVTRDGKRIEIAANIGSIVDAEQAAHFGAEGVGLFRTEFLFMDRGEAPGEEEQVEAYRRAAQALNGAPIIIRTLDIGGDKPIPYLNQLPEENPFLGWRGIRFCLGNPALFKVQLRALLRAGAEQPIKIMLPMVSTVDEVHQTRALIEEVQADLNTESLPFNAELELGIMVETPAAVLNARQLATAVDFFSIGTNDLTQYVMAADRGNAQVANLVDPFQPAVLQAIRSVVQAADDANIWVGMCGEMAGNPKATELLVGLGLNELSMSAAAIPKVKAVIRELTMEQSRQTAIAILDLE